MPDLFLLGFPDGSMAIPVNAEAKVQVQRQKEAEIARAADALARRMARRQIRELKASLCGDPTVGDFCDAPRGFFWRATGAHTIAFFDWPGLLSDLAGGLAKCEIPGCDICGKD